MATSRKLGSWASGALAAGIVTLFIVAMPLAAATTTVTKWFGQTCIQAPYGYCDNQLPDLCFAGVGTTQQIVYTYHHTNGDSVYLPMDISWNDTRSASSPAFDNVFNITAVYNHNNYYSQATHTTTGATMGSDFTFGRTVSNVATPSSMDVTYAAWVHRQSDPLGTNLCYASQTVTYYFIL